MRAVVIDSFGGPGVLRLADVPTPEPGAGQLRIKVAAATVNPVDLATRAGILHANGLMPAESTIGIGWDVSGTVDAIGQNTTGFGLGDRVIGLSDRLALPTKAQADYVVLDAQDVALVPAEVDLVAAASLPLNALTAAQALDLLPLHAGQTLLITGAAGAVGGYAVELAAKAGIQVVAAARDHDEELVHELGATHFVRTPAEVRSVIPGGVDAAIDAASLGISALDAVRGGGAFVAVLGGSAPVPLRGIRVSNVWIRADGARLAELANAGLRLRVAHTMPLADVQQAHRRLADGGLRGRLMLTT